MGRHHVHNQIIAPQSQQRQPGVTTSKPRSLQRRLSYSAKHQQEEPMMKDAAQVSYHHRLILAIEILFKTLSFISFGLRLWARHMSKATLWCDDYIMGLGLVRKAWFNSATALCEGPESSKSACRFSPLCLVLSVLSVRSDRGR